MKGKFAGNQAKGQISKRVFQDKKARQIFQKTSISYPHLLLSINFALKFVLIKLSQTSKNTFQRHSIPVSVIIFLGFYWLNC